MEMSHAKFQLVYDGPALEQHKMDVRALAPALLAMGDLVERTNELINGQQARVVVNVNASFKSGSFGIDLELAQTLWQKIIDFGNSDSVTGVLNLAALLGLGTAVSGTGYWGLIRIVGWMKGRNVSSIQPLADGVVRIFIDNDYIDVEKESIELLRDYRVRKALEDLIARPLENEGIDSFAVVDISTKTVVVAVDRRDAHYFIAPAPMDEDLQTDEYVATLQILNLAFQDGNKWRFTDGGNAFYATMLDDEFLQRVMLSQEQFAKDDLIKARVRRIQKLSGKEGLKSDFAVLQVLEHRSSSPKIQMKIDYNDKV